MFNIHSFIHSFIHGSFVKCRAQRWLAAMMMLLLAHQISSPFRQAQAASDDVAAIKALLNAYFTAKYEVLKSGEAQAIQAFATAPTSLLATSEWLNRESARQELMLLNAERTGLYYSSYQFELDYTQVQVAGDQAEVSLQESHAVVFAPLAPIVSQMAGVVHQIALEKDANGAWHMVADTYQDELNQAIDSQSLSQLRQNILTNTATSPVEEAPVSEPAQPSASPLAVQSTYKVFVPIVLSPPGTLLPYNRGQAVSYANTWWNSTNPSYHRELSNDCTNYVSQAIYAGTNSTMSSNTNYNKDWYYDFWTHTGSLNWVQVDPFHVFITTNTLRGPAGQELSNLCYMSTGDVVQMDNYSESPTYWDHEVIITAIIGQPCYSSSYLVNSHTTDRKLYPLNSSAYTTGFPDGRRYLHITGYRE
ncbi:MAG TPA: amidase domain-containing protein [Anaerolineales bacterium]|nr:amidase domain-containing protein [Anaerolineales bacterium]